MMRAALLAAIATTLAAAPALADPDARACIGANEQSIAHRDRHELLAARERLVVCSDASCPREIRAECERRLAELAAEIPTVVFAAKDGRGDDLAEVSVFVDGTRAATRLDGVPVALDPGEHVFRFDSGGGSVEARAVVREGEKDRSIRVVFPLPAEPPRAPPSPPRRNSSVRAAGVAVASVGLAGLVVGAVFGGLATAAWSRSQTECRTYADCADPASAIRDHDDARLFATVSTVTLIAGSVLVAAGAVTFFVAPVVTPGKRVTAGLALAGRF